jgi:hypothetical protein
MNRVNQKQTNNRIESFPTEWSICSEPLHDGNNPALSGQREESEAPVSSTEISFPGKSLPVIFEPAR